MRKRDKNQKDLRRRFGALAESLSPYCDHLDFRKIDNLDDEGFAFLMSNVRGVNMLDLNGTAITNESIRLLTSLEYVKELRAKECYHLDNNCIGDLNQLRELVFLHVKSTAITIDGLLQLTALPNLKELMFSANDIESIKDKLLQLKKQLPACEFVINSKPYHFDTNGHFLNQ